MKLMPELDPGDLYHAVRRVLLLQEETDEPLRPKLSIW